MSAKLRIRQFTVKEYYQMAKLAIRMTEYN
jgi:hypothetical protein